MLVELEGFDASLGSALALELLLFGVGFTCWKYKVNWYQEPIASFVCTPR